MEHFGDRTICDTCGRPVLSGRRVCVYCGDRSAETSFSASTLKPAEAWEPGYNVVLLPGDHSEERIRAAADLIGADPDALKQLFSSNGAVPYYRIGSATSASTLLDRLVEIGFRGTVVPDPELQLSVPAKRVRTLSIEPDHIVFENFNNGERSRVAKEDLLFMVTGTLKRKSVKSFDERRMLRGDRRLSEVETCTDEPVIDLYPRNDHAGYRIVPAGFDFSCLGAVKQQTAHQNWPLFRQLLIADLPALSVDDEFDRLTTSLELAWPQTGRSESTGPTSGGFGKRGFGKSEVTDNAEQFTRFSRLRWIIYEKQSTSS